MIKIKRIVILSIISLILWFCKSVEVDVNQPYLGGFYEKSYPFFEILHHTKYSDFYAELPFDLKFIGIGSYPERDSDKNQPAYTWVRSPKNLKVLFNSFATVGVEKFVSKKQYFEKNSSWCCSNDWGNKSLAEIVKTFIKTYAPSNQDDYYTKFWKRRELEDNKEEVYSILVQIDNYYNKNISIKTYKNKDSNSLLTQLLYFDALLMHSDSLSYNDHTIEYFDFLKSVDLSYSAFKLIGHNTKFKTDKRMKDSLISTIKHDTLSKHQWELDTQDDNNSGWILGLEYLDPQKNYGP